MAWIIYKTDFLLFIVIVTLTFDLKSNPKQAFWLGKSCIKFELD